MSPAQHYREAEKYLAAAKQASELDHDAAKLVAAFGTKRTEPIDSGLLLMAQVHATLATALDGTASRAEALSDRAQALSRHHDAPD